MERLARELRVSESTLFARFKEATGMTPAQYLKRTRLGEARRRMVGHGDTAAQAAATVGFRSASHFSRDYREAYGRPPAADAVVVRGQLAVAGPV
jgi:AraC-like DNA-binding protein